MLQPVVKLVKLAKCSFPIKSHGEFDRVVRMVSDHPAQPLLLLPPEQKGLPVAVTLNPVAANIEATRIFKGAKETGKEFKRTTREVVSRSQKGPVKSQKKKLKKWH